MNQTVLSGIATAHLGISALHHIITFVLAVIWWQRRRELGRVLSAYLAVCFITVAWSMRGPLWGTGGIAAVALAILWMKETVRPECVMAFARTPRLRLLVAAVGAIVALAYPGYSGELPAFIFAPLGVLIPPTLLLGLSLLVAVDARRARLLTAAHAVAGFIYAVVGFVVDGLTVRAVVGGFALVLLSAFAAMTATGHAMMREENELPPETSVEQIRTRLYQRRTLLPGPRDPKRRRGGRFGRGR